MSSVLHVITTIDRGGAENHLITLVDGQIHRGWRASVAYLKGDGLLETAFADSGAKVHALGLRFYGDPRPALELRRIAAAVKPNVIHVHLPPAEAYARIAGLERTGPPLIITKHNDAPFWKLPASRRVTRWGARPASRVIAISEAVRRYMTGRGGGLDPWRMVVIRYGLDPNAIAKLASDDRRGIRETWGADDETDVIGTIARLVPQKGIDTLLEAFASFCARSSKRSKLVIVGRGPLEKKLRARALELGLDGRVEWAGYREDAALCLQAFDIFALASRYEGFGLVLLEAMAVERPLVATRVSAIPEVVADGVTGLLVPPEDPEAMTGAFLRLSDPAVRRQLGRAGLERVKQCFGVEAMIDKTLTVYEDALRERR